MTELLYDTSDILFHTEEEKHFNLDDIFNFPISTIVYGKILFLLEQLKELNPNGFIIVPTYETENNKQIQLAVTGKCKNNEKPIDAIRREVAEELGFKVNCDPINITPIKDKQNELFFSLLTKEHISANQLSSNFQDNCLDNPNKKVICWVYVDDINEDIIFNRKRRNSNDNAGKTISIIPVGVIKMILEKWANNNIKKISRFSFKI